MQCEALKRPITLDIVVPTDHEVTAGERMPVKNKPYKTLYLLEGVTGNSSGPFNYSRLMPLAEDYNLAVVVIGGENKWWGNSKFTNEHFGDMVTRDVVNFTRRLFNLSRRREDTFIGGFSMGGEGAFVNGLRHPELFSRIISIDAALNKAGVLGSSDEVTWDLFFKKNYEIMFGLDNIAEYENSENDYEYLAKKVAGMGASMMPEIFIACGLEDGMYGLSTAYRDMLMELGYKVTWADLEANHSWYTFDEGMDAAVKWLPTEDNFCGNVIYYGRDAHIDADNFAHWKAYYNLEASEWK